MTMRKWLLLVWLVAGCWISPANAHAFSVCATPHTSCFLAMNGDSITGNDPTAANNTSSMDKKIVNSALNWSSPFVNAYTSTIYVYAQKGFTAVSTSVFNVLEYVFMIWIILQMIYLMLGIQPGQAVAWNVATRSFAFIGISFFISGAHTSLYWTVFLDDPMQVVAGFGYTFIHAGSGSGVNCAAYGANFVADTTCLAQNAQLILGSGVQAGFMMAINQNWSGLLWDFGGIIPTIANFLGGLLLAALFGLNLIYYTFFIIDVATKICLLSAFAPFFIGFYIVKPTRRFATKALGEMVGSFATLMTGSMILGFIALLFTIGPNNGESVSALFAQMNQATGPAQNWMTITDNQYWRMLLIGFSLVLMTRRVVRLVHDVFEGGHVELAGATFLPIAQRAIIGTALFTLIGQGGRMQRMRTMITPSQTLGNTASFASTANQWRSRILRVGPNRSGSKTARATAASKRFASQVSGHVQGILRADEPEPPDGSAHGP